MKPSKTFLFFSGTSCVFRYQKLYVANALFYLMTLVQGTRSNYLLNSIREQRVEDTGLLDLTIEKTENQRERTVLRYMLAYDQPHNNP